MSFRFALVFSTMVVVVDQLTKTLVDRSMTLGQEIAIIPGFFSLTYIRNRGAAFGLMAGLADPWRLIVLVLLAAVMVVVLIGMLRATPAEHLWERLALAGIIGGAIGNLYDRILVGEVIDFLDVFVGTWHWPAFNVADSFITVGVIVLAAISLRPRPQEIAPE